jgi:hypothetical protein
MNEVDELNSCIITFNQQVFPILLIGLAISFHIMIGDCNGSIDKYVATVFSIVKFIFMVTPVFDLLETLGTNFVDLELDKIGCTCLIISFILFFEFAPAKALCFVNNLNRVFELSLLLNIVATKSFGFGVVKTRVNLSKFFNQALK